MIKSPATHAVFLYSSLNPPGELADEKWDMINYVLNHKQGAVEDIQHAIWYFMHMGGQYEPTRTLAWTIINDTLGNGEGFLPGPGQVTAVICYPTILFPNQPEVQISVIEVVSSGVISEFPSALALPPALLAILLATVVYAKKRSTPK